jgi:hypothetical protein
VYWDPLFHVWGGVRYDDVCTVRLKDSADRAPRCEIFRVFCWHPNLCAGDIRWALRGLLARPENLAPAA